MRQKLFASLVTTRPPREIATENRVDASLQEISGKGSVLVPQSEHPLDERMRDLLLRDAALTPADMPGAYGIPSWALDTVRMARAAQASGNFYPAQNLLSDDESREAVDLLQKTQGVQYEATQARLAIAGNPNWRNSLSEALSGVDLSDWDSCMTAARKLVEQAEQRGEQPQPNPVSNKPKPSSDGDEGEGSNGDGEGDEDGEGEGEGNKPGDKPGKFAEPKQNFIPSQQAQDARRYGEPAKQPAKSRVEKILDSMKFDPWQPGNVPALSNQSATFGELENNGKPDVLKMEPRRKRNGARRRPELSGTLPRAMHRLAIDGKIFRGSKTRGGFKGRGTVLVDLSGSMSWDKEKFAKLLAVLPECTVIGYGGNCVGRQTGRLVVLGDRGRCVTMDAITAWREDRGENIVDGPALQFLARMTKPRLWISDGHVTGRGAKRTQSLINQANALMLAGTITRVETVDEAVKIMTGR